MTSTELLRYAGWAAYLSAGATIISFVTGFLFFSKGQPFGTMNDTASVFQVLFMVPVALVLHRLFGPNAQMLSLLAAAVGIVGMLVAAAVQALLVLGRLTFEQTVRPAFTAGGAIAIWLLLTGYLALTSSILPGGLGWLGLLAGAGYVLMVIGFWLGEQKHPLFIIGSFAVLVAYPIWAIWLGRLLVSGRLA
jgi:hypothetical protein